MDKGWDWGATDRGDNAFDHVGHAFPDPAPFSPDPAAGPDGSAGTDCAPELDAAPDGGDHELGELSLARAAAMVVAGAEALARAAARERAFAAGEEDLAGALAAADAGVRSLQAAMVGITREAVTRGVPKQTGHTVFDWVGIHAPLATRADRAAVCAVAKALDHPDPDTRQVHRRLEPQVESGQLGISAGKRLFATMDRIRAHVDHDTYARDLDILTPLAISGTEKELRTATDRLLQLALPDEDPEEASRSKFAGRGVSEHWLKSEQLDTDLYELIITCDTHGQAMFRALFASALTRPCPDPDTGNPDPRTITQRRYDALLTVLGRGTNTPAGAPSTPSATVLVTMTMDQFTHAHAPRPHSPAAQPGTGSHEDPGSCQDTGGNVGTGTPAAGSEAAPDCFGAPSPDTAGTPSSSPHGTDSTRGPGGRRVHTATGDTLTPGEARRVACDAGIIPIVLGGDSQILDVGRSARLATPAQRHALRVRDLTCTYPGCTIPGTWCDAHHLIPWSQGGPTDLDNLALLCQTHHTHVHQHHPDWTFDPPEPDPPWRPASHPTGGQTEGTAGDSTEDHDGDRRSWANPDLRQRHPLDPTPPPEPPPTRLRWLL